MRAFLPSAIAGAIVCVASPSFAWPLGRMDPMAEKDMQAGHEEESTNAMDGMSMDEPMAMSSGMRRPLGIPEERDGSGTSWLPDSSPMDAIHAMRGGWTAMFHENFFAGYAGQGSDRGSQQIFSPNWAMGMARHRAGSGEIEFRGMLSLEPLTVGPKGYPLVLQSGETYKGQALHDRQHPHDLFMEVASIYSAPVARDLGVQLYAAPVGEPALGPTAFPHRPSSAADPLATLGHHWQDSTHISFGVLTGGVFTRDAKLEGSWFNGREPDENRYDFDLRTPDSYSTRLTVNPVRDWSFQGSCGFLKSPETLRADVSVRRISTSAMWNRDISQRGNLATAFIWGRNIETGGRITDGFATESNLDFDGRDTLFGRGEFVTKTGADLGLPATEAGNVFGVSSLVAGYLREFPGRGSFVPGIGVRGTLDFVGQDLKPFYGTSQPVGGMVFLRIRPREMSMKSMSTGGMSHMSMHH